jgi:tetratricopeptide (TPR) repeat protein
MTRARLRALVGGCWLVLCLPTAAHAEESAVEGQHAESDHDAGFAGKSAPTESDHDEEAIQAFMTGKKYFDAGEYELAQEQLEKAYALTNDPELLYDLGQTYRLMGECARAREAYERFLQAAPTSPWVERARTHATVLRAACPPSSAGVRSSASEHAQLLPQPERRPSPRLEAKPEAPRTTPAEPAGDRCGRDRRGGGSRSLEYPTLHNVA